MRQRRPRRRDRAIVDAGAFGVGDQGEDIRHARTVRSGGGEGKPRRGAVTPAVVLVAGPTASGKSALALVLAEALGGVVINADSMQVYRELSILTARPGAAEEACAPHRLYGVMPAAKACSAARWRAMAVAEVAAARDAARLPILVGGTGLYFRALTQGLAPVPRIPADVRAAARDRHARLGGAAFHAELAERDPATARRLAPGDTQRLIRAWEVIEATGIALAEWQRRPPPGEGLSGPILSLVLAPPRAGLYAACDARFAAMVERGALSLDDAIVAAQKATRNYAKRQLTWFRRQMTGARVYETKYSDRLAARIVGETRRFLLTEV
ncbi:MAG: tRNA (adenosine(37)-N6)-dimethylallyltransferase MiaA [Proteobacteria bacterium]|nr:tRNA (adenosine(37)-N6)-dimethylallyltransferase MiaA [Pseudomonadota bacterium]